MANKLLIKTNRKQSTNQISLLPYGKNPWQPQTGVTQPGYRVGGSDSPTSNGHRTLSPELTTRLVGNVAEEERDVSEEEPGSNSQARVRLLDVPVEKCCVLMLVAGKQLGWG